MRTVNAQRSVQALHSVAPQLNTPVDNATVSTVLSALGNRLHAVIERPSSTGSPHWESKPELRTAAPLTVEQRVLEILEQRPAPDKPSLADQILYLLFTSNTPMEDAEIARAVACLLNQPSPQDARKTYAQLISNSGETTTIPSRARRELLPPAENDGVLSPGAWLLQGDSEMAQLCADEIAASYAYSRINGEEPPEENIHNIPPFSTFGIAWAKLSQALGSEPFATFARNNNIEVSSLRISTHTGELSCIADDQPRTFSLKDHSGWSTASSAVLAAAARLTPGSDKHVDFQSSDKASLSTVGNFYNAGFSNNPNARLYAIKYLTTFKTFHDIRTAELPHGFSQRQQAAIHYVNGLTPAQRDELSQAKVKLTPAQRVDADDQRLARLCSRAVANSAFKTKFINDAQDTVDPIPEYSTFGQAQKAFKASLTSREFKAFIQTHGIDLSSISVDPVTSSLICKAKGIDTVFTLNDVSEWPDIAAPIVEAAARLTGGKSDGASYSNLETAPLGLILRFYGEVIPDGAFDQIFKKCAELNNTSFSAFAPATHGHPERQRAAREQQQALKQRLASTLPTASVPSFAKNRVDGDSELALLVSAMMLALNNERSSDLSRMLENIPAHSTFGQWWKHLTSAFNGRAFTEWAAMYNIDSETLVFDPAIKALKAKANGIDQVFFIKDFARDFPALFDALVPLADAANALVAHGQPIMIAKPSSATAAPFGLVFNFYGGNTSDLSSPSFTRLAHDMKRAKAFTPHSRQPEHSDEALEHQKTALGNQNDRYTLINRLKRALNGTRLEDIHLKADPNSSHSPKGVRSADTFINDNGWKVPQNTAEIRNLLKALSTPVPQSSPLADLWGFLSTPVPLSTVQREQVERVVKAQLATGTRLFNYLAPTSENLHTDSQKNLDHLLAGDKAQALGQALQTQMKGFPTSTSISQWILTALILEMDPTADGKRNVIAGFDFMQPHHWGHSASQLLGKFTQHLIDTHKIDAAVAPLAAHVLLSGKAPQFLVNALPSTLIYGTPAWTDFNTAVNRIEQIAPGAVSTMTYQQVMDFHKITPISTAEERQLARAQMNPLIDWGIINDIIDKNDKDEYTFEDIKLCQDRLEQQIKETNAAVKFLGQSTPPTRRALALENLRATFGPDIPYEASRLRKANDSTLQDRWASVLELYEANQLDDPAWETSDTHIPLQRLRAQAGTLPNVTAQFESIINNDYALRRNHSITVIKDLLSKLPLEDRNHLNDGSIRYYSVRESDTSFWENLQAKTGKKGSHGILIRATHNGVVNDYGIFPDAAIIKKIPHLPVPMPIGGTNKSYGKIYDSRDEGSHALPLDFNAFSSPATPRDGVTSNVIVDPIEPKTRINGEMVVDGMVTFGSGDSSISPTYFSESLQLIANIAVDSHFLRKEEFEACQRGHNAFETTPMTFPQRLNFLARMVPGVTSIEDIVEGKYVAAGKDLFIDAMSLVLPSGMGKVFTAVGETFERVAASPLKNGVVDGASEEVLQPGGLLHDIRSATAAKERARIGRLQRADLGAGARVLENRPDIGDGDLKLTDSTRSKVTAVFQNGNWYAYDVNAMTAYGPPVQGFISDASIPLAQETFSDGTHALVARKPLSEQAYTIRRPSGFDVVDGDKVYHYSPENPDLLSELSSVDHYQKPDDIEAFCPAPSVNRLRRETSAMCFTKVLSNDLGRNAEIIQALEHQRFFPSSATDGEASAIIRDRRIYTVVDDELVPAHSKNKPIIYADDVIGTIKKDPLFGVTGDTAITNIEQNTVVIQFGPISKSISDQRMMRGLIVESVGSNPEKHVIAEADTGVFYARKLADGSGKFTKANRQLVDLYNSEKEALYACAGMPKKQNLYQLPTYRSLIQKLKNNGTTEAQLNSLEAKTSQLSAIQKREFLNEVYTKAYGREGKVALAPIQALPLEKPANFDSLSAFEKNEFYAKGSVKAVNEQMAATGLGAGNKLTPTPADFERQALASDVVSWLRSKPNWDKSIKMDQILTTGAGNCGEMAQITSYIIKQSGGEAKIWSTAQEGHVFTVIGGPDSAVERATVDFAEPEWKDAWIVDPWAGITCKAKDYTRMFERRMAQWEREGKTIWTSRSFGITGTFESPLDDAWIAEFREAKTPILKQP
ncbi:hypothetical protein SAMN04490186_3290 [Pseudomonas grimontii]|uniref:Uncharacterized protein n=1 Tax=Pseudomonas grimontii TaxID=129847 RepID=A0A1H1G6V2_9PSED|nr:hypothetical protein [Pseudomonas grimontii]TWR67707.1 hypothetical protein FIV39_09215 [Pseudomonas grimontii]SDR08769.1 hypothetical protein SAMN04490186_3290 [Pseudomonas grimontii]